MQNISVSRLHVVVNEPSSNRSIFWLWVWFFFYSFIVIISSTNKYRKDKSSMLIWVLLMDNVIITHTFTMARWQIVKKSEATKQTKDQNNKTKNKTKQTVWVDQGTAMLVCSSSLKSRKGLADDVMDTGTTQSLNQWRDSQFTWKQYQCQSPLVLFGDIAFAPGSILSLKKNRKVLEVDLSVLLLHAVTDVWVTWGVFIVGGSCHKYHFCHDKCFVATNTCLLWQTCVCHDKTYLFFMTMVCLSRQNFCCDRVIFVVTKLFVTNMQTCLLWQMFCCNKHAFIMTKDMFWHDKLLFVMTKVCLSWQKFYFDKIMFVMTNIFHDKSFVSWQNILSWQT